MRTKLLADPMLAKSGGVGSHTRRAGLVLHGRNFPRTSCNDRKLVWKCIIHEWAYVIRASSAASSARPLQVPQTSLIKHGAARQHAAGEAKFKGGIASPGADHDRSSLLGLLGHRER